MTSSDWLAVLAIAISFLVSVALLAIESALARASRPRLYAQGEDGDAKAAAAAALLEQRDTVVSALRLANLGVTIFATASATSVLDDRWGKPGVLAAVAIGLVVFGLARGLSRAIPARDPNRVTKAIAGPMARLAALMVPVAAIPDAVGRLALCAFNDRTPAPASDDAGTEELRGAVDLLHRAGSVVKEDRDMLGGLLALKDLEVSDVMIHRTKMVAVDIATPTADIIRQVLASPHTRIPVYRERQENIVGVLHTKTLLRALAQTGNDAEGIDVASLLMPPWYVPDTTTLEEQLRAFRKRRMHLAFVVDEYGEVMGIVTLEDILEEIVGDISDEHDLPVSGIRPRPDGSVTVEGAVPVRDLNRRMAWRLPESAATTIAGLVIHEAGIIPEPGQTFTFHGFRFRILRKSRNRITLLKVTPLPATQAPSTRTTHAA
jgi:Mg2+/Co2+ transporter CorB